MLEHRVNEGETRSEEDSKLLICLDKKFVSGNKYRHEMEDVEGERWTLKVAAYIPLGFIPAFLLVVCWGIKGMNNNQRDNSIFYVVVRCC